MTIRHSAWVALLLASLLAGCATPTRPPVVLTPQEEFEPEVVPAPTMLVEYPPIESVEPPPIAAPPVAAPAAAPGTNSVALAAPSLSQGAAPARVSG